MKEQAVLFGPNTSLVGILTFPSSVSKGHDLPAIILLNAGQVPHVGPNRLYVKLARHLAANGFVTLRFDFSGLGDSEVRDDHLAFTKSDTRETQEAMDFLHTEKGIRRFILMGICSGGYTSFATACTDSRVVAAVLINSHGGSRDSRIREAGSYMRSRQILQRFWNGTRLNPKNWQNGSMGNGQTDYEGLSWKIVNHLGKYIVFRMKILSISKKSLLNLQSLTRRGIRLLLVYSEGDIMNREWHRILIHNSVFAIGPQQKIRVHMMRGANHTFKPLSSQNDLLYVIDTFVRNV